MTIRDARAGSGDAGRTGAHEGLCVAAICLAVGLFNVLTASRFPIPWLDEVLFTDPAVNLHRGDGLTSSFWPDQPRQEVWAGYPPLYPVLLARWLSVAGFSMTGVRSFNVLLITAAALLLWAGVRRRGLVSRPGARMLLVASVLLSYGSVFCARAGRVEPLAILLFVALLYAETLPRPWRAPLLVGLSLLVPLVGLQLVLYAAVLGGLLWVAAGRELRGPLALIASGMAAGGSLLAVFYRQHGVWDAFVASTVGTRTLAARGFDLAGLADTLRSYPITLNGFYKDPSYVLLLATALALGALAASRRQLRLRTPLGLGLGVALVVPAVMFLLGVYPLYYSWMAFVPLSICLCRELGAGRHVPLLRAALAAVCLAGLPLITLWSALDWSERDPRRVDALVAAEVGADDWVVTDYPAYYPVKRRAAQAFGVHQARWLDPAERARVRVVIAAPRRAAAITAELGGRWQPSGIRLTSRRGRDAAWSIWGPRYDLAVYRRTPSP